MPSCMKRVTNGQRAAVAGLIIAGVKFRKACAIVGAPLHVTRELLPDEWFGRRRTRPISDHEWAALRKEYEANRESVASICKRHGIPWKCMYNHAKRAGWPMRGAGHPKSAIGVRQMTPKQRRTYRKLQPIIGRDAALKEVFPMRSFA